MAPDGSKGAGDRSLDEQEGLTTQPLLQPRERAVHAGVSLLQGYFTLVFCPQHFSGAGLAGFLQRSGEILLMGSDLMALHVLSKLNTAARKIQ